MKLPDYETTLDFNAASHNNAKAVADNPGQPSKSYPKTPMGKRKVGKIMHEFKERTLHSGKSGKIVTKRDQAVVIALQSARRAEKENRKRKRG